jgi:hypothetical protein
VACLNTGRNFVGFELDPECFQAAQDRLRTRQGSLHESGDDETPPSELLIDDSDAARHASQSLREQE